MDTPIIVVEVGPEVLQRGETSLDILRHMQIHGYLHEQAEEAVKQFISNGFWQCPKTGSAWGTRPEPDLSERA